MNEGNKTKSILIIIGTFLSLLLIVAGIFAAVVGIKQTSCTHVWDDGTVKKEATCTEEGEIVFKCELCDKKQSKTIEKISHTWKYVEAKAATCTEDGHYAYTVCEVCNTYKEGYEFKADLAFGHREEQLEGYAATCTEPGLTAGEQCTRCKEILVPQRTIPALNHTIVQVEAKDATCTEDGNTAGQKCSTCGTVYVGCEILPSFGGHVNENGDELCDRCGVSAVRRITSADEVTVGKWYRFYIDPSNPNSEAYVTFDLKRDGGFDGWYKEVGAEQSVDLPQVTIGISASVTGGFIYWGEDGSERLQVDATIVAGENYLDIYFEEGSFHGASDGVTPTIYFELYRTTKALAVFSANGGYVAVLDETILGYEL